MRCAPKPMPCQAPLFVRLTKLATCKRYLFGNVVARLRTVEVSGVSLLGTIFYAPLLPSHPTTLLITTGTTGGLPPCSQAGAWDCLPRPQPRFEHQASVLLRCTAPPRQTFGDGTCALHPKQGAFRSAVALFTRLV